MADRRSFLRGLVSLPLIGGSVALIGSPTQAAVPVTLELMESYRSWLYLEHMKATYELALHNLARAHDACDIHREDVPGHDAHFDGHPWHLMPQPSTRAAVILSAAGVPLSWEQRL